MGWLKKLRADIQYRDYYKDISKDVDKLLKKYLEEGKKTVIWGAGLKGNAFLSSVDSKAEKIEAVIDMNKDLQGTVLATGHKVVGKEFILQNNIDVVFIMNELFFVDNYFMLEKMGYKGKIFDVDFLVKHKADYSQMYFDKLEQVDLNDDKLFGYKLGDIQMKILEILEEIDRVCKKNGITYFLEAGSALGAYRYNGFLPCDDDIDIAILRDDYDKFLEVAPRELGDKFILQQMSHGSGYPYPYAQVVMDNTCFVRYDFKNLKMHLGIHIDVAPLDNVPSDVRLQAEQFNRVRKLTKLIRSKMLPEKYDSKNPVKKFIVNYKYYLLKFVPLSLLKRKQYMEFTKYNKTDTGYIGDLCTHYKKIIVFKKDKLVPVADLRFVNNNYPVPRNIEYYLSIMYDDYKKMSPREMGSVKYNLVAVSLEKNYDEYNK